MFECNYKFKIEDAKKCAKYVYKSQRRTTEKILVFAIPILLALMIGILVFDIVTKRNVVWDIILIVSLMLLGVLTYIMPYIVIRAQKKQYHSQSFGDMDNLNIKIINGTCEESMVKNGERILHNTHNLKTVVSFIEDNEDLILVYSTGEYTCIKKANLVGDLNQLRSVLKKAMTIKKK